MARKKILTLRKGYEGSYWRSESEERWEELDALGKGFLRDKEMLEAKYAEIEASDLAPEHKRGQLEALRAVALQMQQEYEERVAAIQAELREAETEQADALTETAGELQKQADSLRSARMEVSDGDTTAAAEAADALRAEAEQKKAEILERIRRHVEEEERQREALLRSRMNNP